MSVSAGFPYRVSVGLALIIGLDTVVQLAWKLAADTLPLVPSREVFELVLGQPLFALVIGLMVCQLFIWLWVLGEADLSFAQPFFSLSRITVCLASAYFLHERVTPTQMAGIAMVVAGAWCISRTAHMTASETEPP
jgi:drug/metabolite transporter (DMT)-like permease